MSTKVQKAIPDEAEDSARRYNLVFWLCSDRSSVNVQPQYTTIAMTWAEATALAEMIENREMHQFIMAPMQLLKGENVNFSRHDISAYVIRQCQ